MLWILQLLEELSSMVVENSKLIERLRHENEEIARKNLLLFVPSPF